MVKVVIKLIFTLFTIAIFLYCSSYAIFEITKKNKILSGITFFIFTILSIIYSNIAFWTS